MRSGCAGETMNLAGKILEFGGSSFNLQILPRQNTTANSSLSAVHLFIHRSTKKKKLWFSLFGVLDFFFFLGEINGGLAPALVD